MPVNFFMFLISFYLFSSISVLFWFVFGSFICPYSGAYGIASCAPRISVFETILVILLKTFLKLKNYHFFIVFNKLNFGPFSFSLFLAYFHFFCQFSSIFVLGPSMCPNSGAHGTLSCAPRFRVFKTRLISLFNNFRLGNLLFSFVFLVGFCLC